MAAKEKSASLRSTLNKGSETAFDIHCDLCIKDDKYLEAVGYCSGCEDYLCQECYSADFRLKPSQHHVLLDQHRMPKATSQRQSDEKSASLRSTLNKGSETAFDFRCDLCIMNYKYLEAVGYCSDCEDYLCQECYNIHLRLKPSQHHVLLDQHRMPKATSQRQSDEKSASLRSTLNKGSETAFDFHCDLCIKDDTYLEVVGYCSDCKDYLCQECYNIHLRLKPSQHHVLLDQHRMPKATSQRQSDEKSASLRSTLNKGSETVFDFHCDMCIKDDKYLEAVGYCSDCRDYLCQECYNIHLRPKPCSGHFLLDQHGMPNVADISLRGFEISLFGLNITGSVVLPGNKLVVVDKRDNTVYLINLQSKKMVAMLKYDGIEVWDITAVSNTQVAVTSPCDKKIVFINVNNTLTIDHKVKVKGECYGIACINDNFVITYSDCNDPPKVEIISLKGKLLQTVVTKGRGRQLFTEPDYMAVSPDQQTLYISDSERHTVTNLDLSGQVKATYKDDELEYPCGLTVDRAGVLYVCGYKSNNIHQLTPELHKIQILLKKSDGILQPQSVSLNEEQNKLYIGMDYSNIIKVYQLQ